MKKAINLVMALGLFIAMMSCGNSPVVEDTRAPKERLQGSWEVTQAEGAMSELNVGTTYIFDKTKMTTENGLEISGELQATDSTILWKLETMEMNYSYHFDGNQLIIEPLNSGQVLTLTRK